MDKSSITYSPNTTKESEVEIGRVLGVKARDGIQRYLGLPAFSLRKKRLQFRYLRDRMEKKVQTWSQRDFSAGGKEVLIKSVVQAVPIYAMQCFRLPDSICDDMHRICAAFWWGDKENERHLHWKRWDKLCIPKDKGGMGFRDFKVFNKALVAKQVWRMLTRPDSLVTRVFRAKYFKDGDLLNTPVPARASYVWRSMAWSREIIKDGMGWKMGNGHNICIF
ncbi:uncharacterized mitochondrial protein AtMg00310-like [Salvia miltiorrhiza]|uniref:uncharacterized mitochondrial protein AtMg00310-like n=1 Tax=Salvia miltiorrhiza TaxID=226208 RepID=UPI0025ABCA5C|nr:uncharacterized mitochondrial protein AtMg00310-like [Salvia miltiorrhiza]